jgi:hypothetical protein
MDIPTLATLLHETAEAHHPYEQSGPAHDWWNWYAAYLNARLEGSGAEEASTAAAAYVESIA